MHKGKLILDAQTFAIGAESFKYALRDFDDGAILERESINSGKNGEFKVTQVVSVSDSAAMKFIQSDPHAQRVGPAIADSIRDAEMDFQLRSVAKARPLGKTTWQSIGKLSYQAGESSLINEAWRIIQALEGTMAFYFVGALDKAGEVESFRILILSSVGTAPMQLYVQNRWYSTDPFLIHARQTQRVCYSSDVGKIENLTGSWREMGEFARSYGMKSWLVAPAHDPKSRHFGALYVANDQIPAAGGEEILRQNAVLYRALSQEMFEWLESRRRGQAIQNLGLTAEDLQILSGLTRQLPIEVIAKESGFRVTTIRDKYLPAIKRKFSVSRIDEAIAVADKLDILTAMAERKVAYIVFRKGFGIFLADEFGVKYWSQFNPSGIDRAKIFKDPIDARLSLGISDRNDEYSMGRVDVHATATSATVAECLLAGLPGWEPGEVHDDGPPDESGTWSTINLSSSFRH